jgi:assimilatory nitrate reductase catalytic subunit
VTGVQTCALPISLARAEFVVVQEAFEGTATAAWAHLLLPAASWGEKDGTVTNSERRISRVRPAVWAPGEARNDWSIATAFAKRLEARLRPGRPSLFTYPTPEAVWNEHRESTRGRDLDITGLSYAALEGAPQQWPFPAGAGAGRARLYEDGVFPPPDGRARFADTRHLPLAEPREARYPFSLTTGRLRDQWHGMSRTGTVARLFGHVAEPSIEMHAQDMARLQLTEGDLVHVTSRRGSIVLPVAASAQIAPAQAFVAMHWGEEYLGGRNANGTVMTGINALTSPAFCPSSRQPELKHTAVKILKAELPWRLLAMAWLPDDEALRAREQLRELMGAFAFAATVPFGRERTGVLFRAAAYEPAPEALLQRVEAVLGLAQAGTLRYVDRRRGQHRAMKLAAVGAQLEAFLLAGDTRAEAWVRPLLRDGGSAAAFGRALLQGGERPPAAVPERGKQVCSCFDVGEAQIAGVLDRVSGAPDAKLAQLQAELRCGTNCGSCLPELRRIVRLREQAA